MGEKNKQVFALLILNNFLPISGDGIEGSNTIAINSTELISNQLSNWLSKINNDIDINLRYNPGNQQELTNQVDLALSTQLFDNRVLLETNFGISTKSNGTQTEQAEALNNFIGEFTVTYKINAKGNIVAKIFQRSNELNPVNYNTSLYSQGIGLSYTEPYKNMTHLRCILVNNFKKANKKRDCEAEYFNQQLKDKELMLEEIHLKVKKSRERQNKRNKKKAEREKKAILRKDENE